MKKFLFTNLIFLSLLSQNGLSDQEIQAIKQQKIKEYKDILSKIENYSETLTRSGANTVFNRFKEALNLGIENLNKSKFNPFKDKITIKREMTLDEFVAETFVNFQYFLKMMICLSDNDEQMIQQIESNDQLAKDIEKLKELEDKLK